MTTTLRTDPLRNFKFRVQILPKKQGGALATTLDKIGEIGFAQVSGISVTNEVISYREGGMNTHPHKMVGQSDFAPVSFARGAFAGQDHVWNWQKFMHAWVGGGISGGTNLADGSGDYRCDILVKVYSHPHNNTGVRYQYDGGVESGAIITPGTPKLSFKLFNCWPGAYALTDLNAGDNGIMIQSLTVHHEGFFIDWNGGDISAT